MKSMTLIIGLGNPGEKFKNTRHNTGFMVVDEFAKKLGFPEFKFSKKFNADVSKKKFNGEEVILAKPQTYMNESGRAVKKIVLNVKCLPRGSEATLRGQLSDVWVIHDDLDLEIGQIKIVENRGPAGHNGIKSIIESLGTKDFVRFRVGITPPAPLNAVSGAGDKQNYRPVYGSKDFVLGKFTQPEKKLLKQSLPKFIRAIETSLRQGIEKAMSEFN